MGSVEERIAAAKKRLEEDVGKKSSVADRIAAAKAKYGVPDKKAEEEKPAPETPTAKFDKNKPAIKEMSAFDVDPYAPRSGDAPTAPAESEGGSIADVPEEYTLQDVLARSEAERREGAKKAGQWLLDALALVGKGGDSTNPLNNATVVTNELRDNPEAVQQALDNREAIEAHKQDEADRMQQWANEHKGAASALSVVSSPLSMVDYLQQLVEVNAVGKSLPSENLKPAEITQGLREGVSRDWGNGGKFLYNTGMSGVDSLVAGALSGGMSGVGALILGGAAASSAMNDIKQRGGDDQQAIIGGAASGAFEAIFEKLSLGQLKALKEMPVDGAKTLLKNIAKSVFTNATEEAATELANGLFDAYLMEDLSNYDLSTQEGRSELAKQVGLSAIAGGLMGGVFGSIGSLGGYMNNRDTGGTSHAVDQVAEEQAETIEQQNPVREEAMTNSQAEKIMADPEQMAALGIDPTGKTKAQVRNEVKAAVMGKNVAQTETEHRYVPPAENVDQTNVPNQIAPAERAVYNENIQAEVIDNEKEVYLRDGSQRSGSAYTGGEVSAVEESTGRNPSGQTARHAADHGAASLTYGERVSTASLGIGGGSIKNNIRLLESGDTQHTAEAKRIAKERGLRVYFFADENLNIRQRDGKFASVRGYISGDRVFIRVDHPLYTADQIMRHEAGHDMIAKGEVNLGEVRQRLKKAAGGRQVRKIAKMYSDAYAGTGMTADEIWEEIICDSLGDMNIFAGKAVGDEAGAYLPYTKDAAQAETVESRQERGPPTAGKASVEMASALTYEALVAKPDMVVTAINDTIRYQPNSQIRKQIVRDAIKNAASIGKTNESGGVSVYVADIGSDVLLSARGLQHGLDRRLGQNAAVTLKAGEILKNAILVNELTPQNQNASASYVLIGAAENSSNEPYIVEFVVNRFSNEVESMSVLYSANAKKESAALNAPAPTGNPLHITDSTISIAQLLDFAIANFPDVLPESVLRHYGYTNRPEGVLGESALYSREPNFAFDENRKVKPMEVSETTKQAIKDAQLAGMMNQGRKDAERIRKAKETTADVRRKRDETIQKLKEHQREQKQKASESRHASDYRRRIERHVADLSRTLRNPTDKKHVPEALRGPVAKLLESINLESKGGAPTKRTQAFTDLKKVYAEIAENLVIDPDLLGGEGTTGLLDDVIAMTDKRISEMNTEELDIVWHAIRAIEASIRTANKAFSAGRFQTIQEAADALRSDNMLKRSKIEWNYIDKLQKLTGVDMLTPEAFFHRLGASGDAIFRMMRNAQDKHIHLMKQVADFTNETMPDVDVRALEKEMHTVSLGGQDVEMSTAQIMELYVLMRRPQAMEHLLEGGILPDVVSKRGLKKSAKAEPIHGISADSLFDAISVLTDEQVKVAELLQEYASTVLSDFGNEASMEVYGYRKFNEEHYWPIRSNRQEVKSDIQKDTQVTSVANRGFTKNVKPNANNSVMVGSIFDTFAAHASDMATYAAWLGTSEDVNRIRNFVFRAEGQTVGTVKGILDRVHGVNKGQQYLQKLLADIANGVKGVDVSANLTGGLLGNYKAASVGANLRVVIQQPTAILRAFDMIDPKYFLSTMNPIKGFERAKKYAPIAQWKDWGYFDIHTGKQMKDVLFASESAVDKVKEAAMWGAGKMDSLSWGILWNAVETEVKDKTELNPGTEAFYQKVAERFNEVIDRTQVVDGILQRSQIMRDPGDLKKMVTAFMGEPTKQYNMLLSAAYDAKQNIPKAKRALVRTGITLATSAIINAAVQSIVDAFRDDDREQNYWEKWLEAFVGVGADDKNAVKLFLDSNIFGAINPFSYLPYIKDVWSVILGYDVRRMDMEAIDKTASAAKNLMKSLKGEGSYTVWNAALSMLSEICKITGIPLSNVKREITSLAITAAVETDSYLMEYRIRKTMYKVPENTTMYYDILYSAYMNDADAYEIIYDDMVKSGLGEDKIRTAMESRMKRDQKVESVSDLEKRYLSPAQQRSYDAKMSSMETSSLWKRANATQRSVAENALFELVTGNDKMLDKLEDGARYGVSDTEYALYQMALSMADKPTDSGKYGTYTNGEVEAAIKMLGLSRKESSWLWEAQGKNAKSNPFK